MKFDTQYSAAVRVKFRSALPSRTKQQFAAEADINNLIERYKNTGAYYSPLSMMQAGRGQPSYEDLSGLGDVGDAMETVRRAAEIFDSLPSDVRMQFGNSPAAFVTWAQSPSNLKSLAKLGVVEIPKEFLAPAAAPEQPPAPVSEANGSGATVISQNDGKQ